jgi:hypothetical protein
MKLHEFHARSLEATLCQADESIHRMEQLLTHGGQEGVVRSVESKLSEQARKRLLAGVLSLRALLATMAQTFSLEPRPLDLRRVMHAEISGLWVLFENCRPERMKGYGQEFTQEARAALEQNVEALLAEILSLRAQLR